MTSLDYSSICAVSRCFPGVFFRLHAVLVVVSNSFFSVSSEIEQFQYFSKFSWFSLSSLPLFLCISSDLSYIKFSKTISKFAKYWNCCISELWRSCASCWLFTLPRNHDRTTSIEVFRNFLPSLFMIFIIFRHPPPGQYPQLIPPSSEKCNFFQIDLPHQN